MVFFSVTAVGMSEVWILMPSLTIVSRFGVKNLPNNLTKKVYQSHTINIMNLVLTFNPP